MNYYQDITLLPSTDIELGFLWQKVYQQVHIALVEQKVSEHHSAMAVSFPSYDDECFSLGNKLRLLAKDRDQLERLNLSTFLNRLNDYVHLKSIQSIPALTTPVAFVRQRVKGKRRLEKDMLSKAQLWSRKSGKSISSCLKELEKSKPKPESHLPFIWIESQETKAKNLTRSAKFPLFIARIELDGRTEGVFNCYGLSVTSDKSIASVPHF